MWIYFSIDSYALNYILNDIHIFKEGCVQKIKDGIRI